MEIRALETWTLSSQGLNNQEIAERLGCSIRSILRYQVLWRSDPYLWGAAFAAATKRQHEQQRKTDPQPGQPVAAGFRLWRRLPDGTRELISSYEPPVFETDDTNLEEGPGSLGMDGSSLGDGEGVEPINAVSPPKEISANENHEGTPIMPDDKFTPDDEERLGEYLAGAAAADSSLEYHGSNRQLETVYRTTAFFIDRLGEALDGQHRRPGGVCDCRLCTVLRDHGVNVDGPPPTPIPDVIAEAFEERLDPKEETA